ncbi:MAG: hypothetical protein U0X91_03430 [Spirosomataceae bacterium]
MKPVVFLTLFALFYLTSCQRSGEENTVTPDNFTQFQTLIQQNTRLQTALSFIIQLTADVMEKAKVNGRISAETGEIPTCAHLQTDLKNKTLTVDFAGGCNSPYGTLKGSVTIQYTGGFGQTGASVIVRINNFAVGDIALNGTLELNDFKKTGVNLLEYNLKLTDLTALYQNKVFKTTMEMGQSWKNFQTVSANDDEINTSLKGTYVIDELTYDVETTANLLVKGTCSDNVAVSGLLKMTAKGITATLDYGAGNCDTVGTLTVGGQSKTVELR